ncbi:MAG: hypothetical protein ACO3GA_03625 [Candidatus Limnocylindrus sp.]
MTKIEKPFYTTKERNLKLMLRVLVLGVLLGVVGSMAFAIAKQGVPPDDVTQQQHQMHKACQLPDVDGAMTVFVMEDGKIKCWRWK